MKQVHVFFNGRMVAESRSFSPSSHKASELVKGWAKDPRIKMHESRPASKHDILQAHSKWYVEGVMSCELENGFNNFSPSVAASLPYQVGSLLSAAEFAVNNPGAGVCSPSAGFHHAHHNSGHGFCTFNGLAIAAMSLLADRKAGRVGILDLDFHLGDGTRNIIKERKLSRSLIDVHWSDIGNNPDALLDGLPNAIRNMADCDLILYQAGADMSVFDPLGGLLDDGEMRERDRLVFESCAALEIPVVFNLAGGYQRDLNNTIEPVLALHRATMQECIKVFAS